MKQAATTYRQQAGNSREKEDGGWKMVDGKIKSQRSKVNPTTPRLRRTRRRK